MCNFRNDDDELNDPVQEIETLAGLGSGTGVGHLP